LSTFDTLEFFLLGDTSAATSIYLFSIGFETTETELSEFKFADTLDEAKSDSDYLDILLARRLLSYNFFFGPDFITAYTNLNLINFCF
jgi:hypothetical protein